MRVASFLVREDTPAERLRNGDLAALGEIYDEHHEHVRAFARRLLGDASAAEDLTQETFVTLSTAVHGYRGEAPLRSFLLSIAVNHARHHLRGAVRRRAAYVRSAAEAPRSGPRTPLDEAQRAELARRLTRALDALPLGQRAAIVLCEVEGRTSGEVAE